MTIEKFIEWETRRRRCNVANLVFYVMLLGGAALWFLRTPVADPLASFFALVGVCCVVAMIQGMSNIVLLAPRLGEEITSSEDEIRVAYESGPTWFRRMCEDADKGG